MTGRVEHIGDATLYLGDCREILPTLGRVDAVVTDPPYFRVKEEPWDNQWKNPDLFLEWLGGVMDAFSEIMHPWASLYCFASPQMEWHIQKIVRERFVFLNSIRWKKPQGWHLKQSIDELRIYQQGWEACIFAQKADDSATLEANGYERACTVLHKRVFMPIGRYFLNERLRAGFSYRQIADFIGRDTALYLRWEEGSSLPNPVDYEKCRTLFNGKPGEYLQKDYDDLRKDYDDLLKDYYDLRKDYDDLRRPFNLHDKRLGGDIWEYNTVNGYHGKHPCEKPTSIIDHIIGTSSKPNQLVLDPFCGSGTAGVSCARLGRSFIGIEIEERYFDIACRRIEQAQRQPDMFISAPAPTTPDMFAGAA